ncbi:hypothetical protein PR202_gb06190 [Eleusine coracana subsp. coracana]|uniref:Uncharacterized protein n=1 Tax=Eleusine coracana subsp. coracana TaxID=191504 RepID=A0AAV5E996_ELECO|nr:hypothetical protein PR202_gb06190 [Eleusine coracana subsp. coracana]
MRRPGEGARRRHASRLLLLLADGRIVGCMAAHVKDLPYIPFSIVFEKNTVEPVFKNNSENKTAEPLKKARVPLGSVDRNVCRSNTTEQEQFLCYSQEAGVHVEPIGDLSTEAEKKLGELVRDKDCLSSFVTRTA